jgi:hypothetical protein
MSRVWFIQTEVRAQAGSDFPGSHDAAIWVECFVPTSSIQDAIRMANEALEREHYRVIDITRAMRLDLQDWDYDEYPRDSTAWAVVQRVVESGEVELGPFCYGNH